MELTRIQLPGFGRPVNYYQKHENLDAFPNALNPTDMREERTVFALTTLREFTMLHIMNYITDMPDWRNKVFSDDIANNWKREVSEMPGRDISRPMMDWVIGELRYKAKLHEDIGAATVYTGHVVKSDSVVPESLKLELQAAVAELEDVPDKHKDWHPGSDGKVLDLVHPSLHPLVYGRTKVLETGRTSLEDCIARCGEGQTTQIPPETETVATDLIPVWEYSRAVGSPYSRNFQWLPCTVDISGEYSKITSYINNLHPVRYKGLYRLIERVIDAAIPLWNLTLGPLEFFDWSSYLRIHYHRSYGDLIEQPEPDIFKPPTEPDPIINLKEKYLTSGLQIIVKLANIHLTPENPSYEGGSWHVNEHICATALYYYSNENIEPSNLAFRQQSNTKAIYEMEYEQDYHDWFPAIFGCESGGPGVQVVGSVETREGRLLTFPNILQHQVQPFSLADPTKPGHRKILALFLVDPNLPILSTANVPCQQRDWWRDYIGQLGTGLNRLSVELQDAVFNGVTDDFPFGLDEAKDLRLELMDERKIFTIKQDRAFEAYEFSLCEH
ncbi:hypothetical protein BYT27DRAFT_7235520 [Phlegmacium glaucopus]|nr:hypothetical protein BYT27DRAFT_7235520 [Phlegmacium glaucopus]